MLDGRLIALTQGAGVADQVAHFFHAFELGRPRVGEVEFLVVHHVEDHHVVAARAQQPQSLEQTGSIDEQV